MTLPLELRSLDVGKTVLLTLSRICFQQTSDVSSLIGVLVCERYSICVTGIHRR